LYGWALKGGTAVNIIPQTSVYPISTSSSTSVRTFKLETQWIQDENTAREISGMIGALLATKNKYPIIQIQNRPYYQFVELFDHITLDIPYLGINTEDFRIGGIEHFGNPQELRTVLYLEKYIST